MKRKVTSFILTLRMDGVKIGLQWVTIYWAKAFKQDSLRSWLSEFQHGNALVLNFGSFLLVSLWITCLKIVTIVNCPNFLIKKILTKRAMKAHSGWILGNRIDLRTWMINLAASALMSWWMGTADKSIQMRTFWKVGQWWKTAVVFCSFVCLFFGLLAPDCTILLYFGLCLVFIYPFLCCWWSISFWECWFLKKDVPNGNFGIKQLLLRTSLNIFGSHVAYPYMML